MTINVDDRFFPLILDTISHGIFTIDEHGLINSFNQAAEEITGFKQKEVLGKPCAQIFQADICETQCPLKHSISTQERTEDRKVFISKKNGQRLPISISTAALVDSEGKVIGGVEMFRDTSTVEELRKRISKTYSFEDIVTKSPLMKNIFDILGPIANSKSTVLINGDSGTGKELIARAIHNLGPRRSQPFIAVNCAALPDNLLESELFGYKKGAFTDAKKDKPGRFARAEKGTLFLDEIGELSPAIQAKLLRVLEEQQYEPLGATSTVASDVRIITATNKILTEEIKTKNFRQDLYFRLNVVNIDIPTLNKRKEDIPLLVEHFIKRFNALQGRRILRCSERVMTALMVYDYPGNIRELENAIEHAFVICGDNIIQFEDLPPHITESIATTKLKQSKKTSPVEKAEAEILRLLLVQHDGNRKLVANELGISRTTLWRKLKRYNIIKD